MLNNSKTGKFSRVQVKRTESELQRFRETLDNVDYESENERGLAEHNNIVKKPESEFLSKCDELKRKQFQYEQLKNEFENFKNECSKKLMDEHCLRQNLVGFLLIFCFV